VVAGGWSRELGIGLRADALGVSFALVSSAVLLAATAHEVTGQVRTRSFPALVAFMGVGLNGLFLTGDVFNFYVFFELSMIAAIALVAYGGEAPRLRAAYTFAVVNLLGSVFFVAGTAAIYHVTGTLEMAIVAERVGSLPPETTLAIAAVFFVAFGVKLGLFPFHFWVPPVYRDAHPAVAAILSGALANVGSYGLLRFGGDLLGGVLPTAGPLLAVLAMASVVYGSVLAMSRARVSEVLAYSSISQAGYILLVITLATPVAFAAAVVYAFLNALNKTLLFLSLRLGGPVAWIAFGVGAASVAGLPPAAGFFGKASLVRAAVSGEASAAFLVVVVAGSVLSIAYMARAYARQVWLPEDGGARQSTTTQLVSGVLAAALLTLGLWPEPLLSLGRDAGRVLGGVP
jgi:multicomponent Na+:H+ antiporter subunit D